jgi:outer membrane protein OmpA-like peptidoglycan-associated protein
VAPPAATRGAAIVPGQPVAVAFASGSAALPPGIEAALARLAATRGAAPMRVAGFGAAAGDGPAVQAAALDLAFARAEAIANALARAGVPLSEIRLTAAAQGRGGVAAVAN